MVANVVVFFIRITVVVSCVVVFFIRTTVVVAGVYQDHRCGVIVRQIPELTRERYNVHVRGFESFARHRPTRYEKKENLHASRLVPNTPASYPKTYEHMRVF